MSTSPSKVWLITGTTSGFGHHLAELLLEQGHSVVATARKPERLAGLAERYPATCLTLQLDVTSQSSVTNAVADAIAHFGRIDVLINNAGYGLLGAIEEVTEAEYMPMFETNVFGLIRLTREVVPHLRAQHSGHIVNLSSIGGLIGGAGWGYYAATKFAVNGFSEALAAELAPLGITVTVVEPGPFRTEFLGIGELHAKHQIADYDSTVGETRKYAERMNGKQPGDPIRAAQAIIDTSLLPVPPKHLVLGKIALTRFRKRLEDWTTELDQWEATTIGADYPADEAQQAK